MAYTYLNTSDNKWWTANKKHSEEWLEIVKDKEGTITAPEGLVLQIAKEALEATQAEFRATRNALLQEVDIEINIAEDAGLDLANLRTYRQALRDSTVLWVLPERIKIV